ncbi:MAG: serine/threonine-protein kinase [Candidatus Melainabacteria bacterium]|nr:serine/threonine-protein kinase [Candidatus Melainabacteria bacterium]
MPHYARSPAPRLSTLPHTGKPPLYRIQIPNDFKDLLVGATLGSRYWVLSVIGRGGMSVVYKAKVKDSGKIVAVKTLRTAGMTDDMVVKRFQREAELLSRLNHPRIVNLHAYGSSAKGQPYFVMDYLIGQNLTDLLARENHLEPERFQDIFVQVCAAIEHAHRQGAIHRDIKPGNIMLTRQGATTDYVKVVDFGIAKMAEEAQRLTRMGEVWGSPIYMSPEQCMGAPVDARSDIYSLGIVMYESLTGKVPFLGRNYADTMTKQISDDPAPFAKIRPDLKIPGSLEKIVMAAMAKQPEDRYQSLGLMRKDLEAALSARATTELPLPAAVKPNKAKVSTTGMKRPNENSATSDKLRSQSQKIEAKAEAKKTAERRVPSKRDLVEATRQKRKRSTTLHGLPEKRSLSRGKQLLVVALTSLLFSLTLIAIISNAEAISHFLAFTIKALVGGPEDNQSPFSEPSPESQSQSNSDQNAQPNLQPIQ